MNARAPATKRPLRDRVAVITGAGTGIGASIALRLARDGADVALHVHDVEPSVGDVAAACGRFGVRAIVLDGDFAADPGRAAGIVDAAADALGCIDVLVNNAAITTATSALLDHSPQSFEEMLRVNVTAPFLATQAAARHMRRRGMPGRIINIGSIHQRVTNPETGAYAITKKALEGMTIAASVSLGAHGIAVNCVAPGAILVERYDRNPNYDRDWYERRTPLGRIGRPDDVAGVVAFLASDDGAFITGETIYVDGGATRRNPFLK